MSRETLKDFLNSIGESSDSISFTYDSDVAKPETGVDLGKDSATGKSLLDLDNENVGLLGDYLSFLVENSSNIFKIDSGNERATASKRGESLVLPEEQGASQVFVTQGTELSQNLNSYSNSGKFDAGDNSLKNIIDKTGEEKHGHFTFRDIEGSPLSKTNKTSVDPEGENSELVQSVNDILSTHNRFANVANGKVFSDRDKPIKQTDSDPSLKYSKDFGKSNINKFTVSLDQLKDVGKSLLLKTSGYDNTLSPGDSLNPKQASEDIDNGLTNNNFDASGYHKKSREIFRSKNAFGAPQDDTGNSLRTTTGAHEKTDPDAKNATTFGSTYNSEFNFTRTNPKIHKLQAAIACKVLIDISKDFMTVITDIVKSNDLKVIQETNSIKKENIDRSNGPFIKGVYNKLASFDLDLLKKLTLVKTTFPYPDSFEKGIEVFFGNDLEDVEKISESNFVSDSPGYWLNVASGILKTFDQVDNEISRIDQIGGSFRSKINTIVRILQSNSIIKFANAAATVGDIYLKTNNGLKNRNSSAGPVKRPFSVDSIPTTPGTRIAKSKDENGRLAWRQSSVPNAYLLPRNVIRAGIKLNNITRGAWPARGMLGSELIEDTYLDRKHDGSFNRIPEDIIKNLEDRLEAEYVPFYIQDLRTNEIISFHAFLTQLSDTISPSFSDTPGYGRLDPVQTYNGTRRSLQVGFILYATSREDYDQMWYKINKLTTLLYPQWTQGTKVSGLGVGDSFVQPFSQVLGASPLVRLRVGDVIKSNYSKFNLARLFGIGDPDINPITDDFPSAGLRAGGENILNLVQNIALEVFYGFFGSPLQYIPQKSGINDNGPVAKFLNVGLKLLREYLSDELGLKNGFANPYGVNLLVNKLTKPTFESDSNGYNNGDVVKIKPNVVKGYRCEDDGEIYYFDQFVNGKVLSRKFNHNKVFYKIDVLDSTNNLNLFNKKLFVSHDQILPDYRDIFINFGDTPIGSLFQYIEPRSFIDSALEDAAQSGGIPINISNAAADLADIIGPESERFMLAENNPFVRAYESTMGRGLAGTIGNIGFNWLDGDYTWETDYNSRAPKGVAISFSFNAIHDIAPGLDHSGYNRAPLYNVGNIMKEVAGDPHGDVLSGESKFKKNKIKFKTGE